MHVDMASDTSSSRFSLRRLGSKKISRKATSSSWHSGVTLPTSFRISPQKRHMKSSMSVKSLADSLSNIDCSTINGVDLSRHSAPGLLTPSTRQVSWDSIEIREYERAVTDNPSVTSGPALGLGWSYANEISCELSSYEENRLFRRDLTELRVPRIVRESILKEDWGISRRTMDDNVKSSNIGRQQRRRTSATMELETTHVVIESAVRKLKRLTGILPSKKKEQKELMKWAKDYEMDQSISSCSPAVSLVGCTCQNSLFSGNVEHVEFFLPKLVMICTCSKQIEQEICTDQNEDPLSLQNILRPWQVEFLETQSIETAVELVHAFNQRGSHLAEDMRLWRKLKRLVSIKTKSCGIALHIWSRTCKAVTRNVRKQLSDGVEV